MRLRYRRPVLTIDLRSGGAILLGLAALAQAGCPLGVERTFEGERARPAPEATAAPARAGADGVDGGRDQPMRREQAALTREALAAAIGREREGSGAPPLILDPRLDGVAQERADEIVRRGALPDAGESVRLMGVVQRRLVAAGYVAHGWAESAVATEGDAGAVLGLWREDPQFLESMRPDYRHLGIGIARLEGAPLYVFLVAWPEQEFFERENAGLADLEAVRREMLVEVNRLRAEAGRRPLSADARLDAAAQAHADDMLRRSYYGHRSADGRDASDRVRAAGYAWRAVGENVAAGHPTVAAALAAWLESSEHRANLLSPAFVHLGIGVALGASDHRYRVLWVQDFGAPLEPSAEPR